MPQQVGSAKLACEWTIPAPPSGETFDPALTNVGFSASATATRSVPHVVSASACSDVPDGWAWYYDDEALPTKILICPAACELIEGDAFARIEIAFGCPTIDVVR